MANIVGTAAQLALVEEFNALYAGQTVVFLDNGKRRTGAVLGYELFGGAPWRMNLRVKVRGGWVSVRLGDVLDYAA